MSEDKPEQPTVASVAGLVDPNVPADQGLSTLGLVLQLAGTLFAAYGSLFLFVMLLIPRGMGPSKGYLLIVTALCIVRSAAQRAAGTEILYGKRGLEGPLSPLLGLRRYVGVGLVQSAILGVLLYAKFGMPLTYTFAIFAGLAAWPALLGVFMQLPRFKRYSTEIPIPEDKGFEAAGILMTVFGTCGVLGIGAVLIILLESSSGILSQGPGVLLLVALVMLLIRSIFHVQAGLSNLRETKLDRAVELANRYANFGVIASFCAAGAMLIVSMMGAVNIGVVAIVAGMCWILMAWPLIIRRFYSERQFADLMAGDQANLHRRAPDAGLTGLGWLLLAHAMLGIAFVIPQLVIGPDLLDGRYADMLSFMGPLATRSLWWTAGLVTLQAWAGYELIRQSPQSRAIGTVFAVVATAVTIYLMWPVLHQIKELRRMMSPASMMMLIPLAIQLVLPVATLLLVNRKIAPVAQARFRPRT